MLQKAKGWLQKKKTYLILAGAVLATVVAWSGGDLSTGQAVTAIFAAAAGGAAKAGANRKEDLLAGILDKFEGK